MHAVFGAEITLYNPTNEILQWCRKNLWVTNPEFVSRKRMNKWLGNTPEKLMLYKRVDGFRDMLEELIQTFDKTVGKLLHSRDVLYDLLNDIEAVKEFVENEKKEEG